MVGHAFNSCVRALASPAHRDHPWQGRTSAVARSGPSLQRAIGGRLELSWAGLRRSLMCWQLICGV